MPVNSRSPSYVIDIYVYVGGTSPRMGKVTTTHHFEWVGSNSTWIVHTIVCMVQSRSCTSLY